MNSGLRESRIFHRYHQAHNHRDENLRREGDTIGAPPTPTRTTSYPQSTKASNKTVTTDRIVDDLTQGYYAPPGDRLERNPTEYEASPSSSKSFRIVSLDGCYEEHVSPSPTDSTSSISSYQIRNVPTIPSPHCETTKRDNNFKKQGIGKFMTRIENEFISSEQNKEAVKITPPANRGRRRSSHNRSRFVFDGNLSFEDISPSPMYASVSPILAYLSPPKLSYPDAMMINCPPTATSMSTKSTMLLIQHTFFGSGSNVHREQQQKEGRSTPPPTPEEQRRRNRALPSAQYENLVFNPLRQEQREKQEVKLMRLNT